MDLEIIEAIERAAKALDAAGEAVGAGLGERPQLAEMLALWLMEEAGRLRDALGAEQNGFRLPKSATKMI